MSQSYSDHDLVYAAHHEAGHGIIASVVGTDVRVAVRDDASGVCQWSIIGSNELQNMRDQCCVSLGGAVAAALHQGHRPEETDPILALVQERDRWTDDFNDAFNELTSLAEREYGSRDLGRAYVVSIAPGPVELEPFRTKETGRQLALGFEAEAARTREEIARIEAEMEEIRLRFTERVVEPRS